ncbi:redox-sensing transcriptional repressor Rex [candidate division KSB1 bacterium]|nr:redox-sensing transcriptional repressor Rex [candidate division KSB1 bacterium]
MGKIPVKTLERLILYRRLLLTQHDGKSTNIFSHQLAKMTGFTSAQIRRDLMVIGYSGSPVRGYMVEELIKSLGEFIDATQKQGVALVGLGHLGRAILSYFQGRRPKLEIAASFDRQCQKIDQVVMGCRCYHIDDLENIVRDKNILVGIIAVPADEAQDVADRLVHAGIRGIVNFAPVKLELPPEVYVENRDMIMAVEKAAYYARKTLD